MFHLFAFAADSLQLFNNSQVQYVHCKSKSYSGNAAAVEALEKWDVGHAFEGKLPSSETPPSLPQLQRSGVSRRKFVENIGANICY